LSVVGTLALSGGTTIAAGVATSAAAASSTASTVAATSAAGPTTSNPTTSPTGTGAANGPPGTTPATLPPALQVTLPAVGLQKLSPTAAGTGSTTTTKPSSASKNSQTIVDPHGGTTINGDGSSFAAPAIETFGTHVSQSPYSLSVNYSSTSSGDGRYEFTNRTTDFAVSDIAYGLGSTDTTPPSYPYIYVPVTAGGIAFMYNIPGLTKTLQLSSYTACLVMTGGVTNWNSPLIATDNPGVTLPNQTIVPVTESDSAGTNYVLEEWCIAEQPALWATFANHQQQQSGGPTDGVAISPTSPNSNWPGIAGGLDTQSTSQVAGDVATNAGAIGAVQVKYATDLNFGGSDPTKGVASVKNASNDYTQPTPVDVASALAYATQLANGTHQLNFNGAGPHVYNPSTYSYLLTPTQGWQSAKGAVLSGFVNYVLTLGQQLSPSFGYASLGLSLERFGITAVTADVPGAVPVTAAEQAAYACGDLTPTEVAAGQTTPTCGVTTVTVPPPPPGGVGTTSAGGGASTTAAASGSGTHASGTGASGSTGSGSSGSGGTGVDAGVSLGGSTPLAFTGGNPVPVAAGGALLVIGGWMARRRLLRGRRAERTS
jgi:ABC-type phosphate transport system substrate-binding protein